MAKPDEGEDLELPQMGFEPETTVFLVQCCANWAADVNVLSFQQVYSVLLIMFENMLMLLTSYYG